MNIDLRETPEGQQVVSSREVAKNFEKRHADVLSRVCDLIEEIQPTKKSVGYFITSTYTDLKGEMRKEYLLTRDGFSLLAMGFTGTKALEWKLKYIEAFNAMQVYIENQNALNLQEMNDRVARLEQVFDKMTLDYAQQCKIKNLVKDKVKVELGGYGTRRYRAHSKKCFARLYMLLQNTFEVRSYVDIPVNSFGQAVQVISEYRYRK